MKRGKNIKSSVPHSCVDFTVAVLGAGAAAPTIPANGNFTPTTSTYPLRANGVDTVIAIVRSSTGVYVIPFAHQLPNVLFGTAAVLAAGGSPSGNLAADVVAIDPVARTCTVKVTTITADALTDIGTSDMLVIYLHGQDSES